ncbi:MAG TPA: TonB-dependent receptor, partial [Bacteroidales bacterium]
MMKSTLVLLFCFIALAGYGQTLLKGKIVDSKSNEPLAGATIVVKGTSNGTAAGLDGDFSLKTDAAGDQKLVITLMGYSTKEIDVQVKGENVDVPPITLENSSVGLDEVMVIASMAVDRKTPVAVSSISQSYIEDKLGNDEFPEIMSQTPGVYATKQGGAFGDSRINIRGFDSPHVAVMINGIPVNDMENGWVYWSNWAGLADVTRNVQVQRGLGAAKAAVPSVGGTINIITQTTDAKSGGDVFTTIGNDNMIKYGAMLSTGLSKNNWASTVMFTKNTGNGYADATQYEAYSYFFNLSKKINAKHTIAFTLFGAPQWHNQRSYQITFSQYEKYNSITYNDQWGYKDGQIFNVKKNHFHKPQASLNHYWTINENTSLSTSLYASIGTGGGTGLATSPISVSYRTNDGLINFTKLDADNAALGTLGSSNIVKDSRNDHSWYGILSTLTHTRNNLTLTGGVDVRTYIGKHYQTVYDLLGGQFFIDKISASNGDVNNPNKVAGLGDEVGYHDDGHVNWYGTFGQAEYTMNKLSVFVAGALSDKWYQRVDYMRYFSDDLIAK